MTKSYKLVLLKFLYSHHKFFNNYFFIHIFYINNKLFLINIDKLLYSSGGDLIKKEDY